MSINQYLSTLSYIIGLIIGMMIGYIHGARYLT